MGYCEKSVSSQNNKIWSKNDLEVSIFDQLGNSHSTDFGKSLLNKTKQISTISAIAITCSWGIDAVKPERVLAQQVSATWAETASLTSILTGYESIVLGLEEVGISDEVTITDHSFVFSETIAALTIVGTVGDADLFLNGNGVLSGDVGTEDLSWSGDWLGTLGSEFISATDTGTFALNGSNEYSQLNFQQLGFKDFDSWDASTTGDLTSSTGGSLVSGWALSGTEGIGNGVDAALADLETQFLASGNSVGSSLTVNGNAQSFLLSLDNSTTIIQSSYSCEEGKNCTKKPVSEPTSMTGIFLLLGLWLSSKVFQLSNIDIAKK